MICPVCWWEDDDIQERDPDFAGGANGVSLRRAQQNFLMYGAVEEKYANAVRKPNRTEIPEFR